MRGKIARVLGSIIVLIGLGDAIAAGSVLRQMLGGVSIILGVLIFILAEVCEISDKLKQRGIEEKKVDLH